MNIYCPPGKDSNKNQVKERRTTMEYTKGEWKREGHAVVSDALQCGIWLYKIADVTAHAQVETIANANLISAAPDLYQALLAVYQDIDIPNTLGGSSELDISVQQALAKAEVK